MSNKRPVDFKPQGSETTSLPISEEFWGESLNPAQWEAVRCIDAPSLVIAGAGSGKTRVLTYKIAWLMQQGIEPWSILALTFTNKAAREMRERIGKLVGEHEAAPLWMGTFHSIFSRILRIECDTLGFTPHYTIYDDKDSASLIKTIIREMGFDDKVYRPGVVAHRISEAKNELIRPSQYARNFDLMRRDQLSRMSRIHEIYSTYQQRLRQADAMDFDDLLLNTYILLSEHEDIRSRYEERFQFVLVDEYQDTNYAQHRIVWLLTEHRQRVCVVGDDAQSIYSFRGARIDNILTFQKMYRDAKLFKLEQNYRSTQTIVAAANSIIKHNRRQIQKSVFSEKEVGEQIPVLEAYSDKEEASVVARRIYELCKKDEYNYGDIAILYRTNDQSRVFEEEFLHRKYPYRIYGGLSFYQRKEVKDALAYMRLVVNQHDEEALRRIVNVPARGIGKTTLDKVFSTAVDHAVPPFEVLSNPLNYGLQVSPSTQTRLQRFAELIESYNRRLSTDDASIIAQGIVKDSGLYAEIFAGKEPEDRDRQANLQELMDSITSFVDDRQEEGQRAELADFLQSVSLMTDADKQLPEDGACITLMTIHSAKGLEFPVVFVVGLEESLFPSEMAIDEGNIEEERRLFYVATTRAQSRLYFTWSHSRVRYGKFQNNQRSRFLNEIDSQYLTSAKPKSSLLFGREKEERPSSSHHHSITSSLHSSFTSRPSTDRTTPVTPPPSMKPVRSMQSPFTGSTPLPSGSQVSVGSKIEHVRFGRGVVTALEGSGLDTKATVVFENAGQKQLLLRFARFKVIG
ncbi:MAG: UvrD-helicase domain-containing protein [Bacteroidaceae bacterium]|nr:UvrD-helicase domain-containing protein [Bacteroidaceae bacterium]